MKQETTYYCYDCAKETEESALDYLDEIGELACPKCGGIDLIPTDED